VRETLPACAEIIVVDDGSDDGCADFLRGASDLATLIEPGERLGAIGARNLAAAHAGGRTLVFLDAHVEMTTPWIDPLLDVLEDPAVGAVSPAISVLGREDARGYGLCWTSAELACAWLPPPSAPPFDVPLLPGACLAIRRHVFLSVGGFDRGLIRWGFEDGELSIRLWRLGYELRVVPDVAVAHLFRERHPYTVDWLWIVTTSCASRTCTSERNASPESSPPSGTTAVMPRRPGSLRNGMRHATANSCAATRGATTTRTSTASAKSATDAQGGFHVRPFRPAVRHLRSPARARPVFLPPASHCR
jgi:hypothetical protein